MNDPNPNPSPLEQNPSPAEFKDRKAGLIAFGILTILLGCLCALLLPLMIFSQTMSARVTGMPPNYQAVLPAIFMYGLMAVILVWLGIGSIMARRWARALLLIFSWSWLVIGVVGLFAMAFVLPQFLTAMQSAMPPGQPQLPAVAKLMMVLIPALMLSLMFLILPGAWVLFYRSGHVKATCEARDPVPRWTDHCPLPVLAVSLWLGLGVPMMLAMPLAYHGVLPFFGIFISGLPGTVVYVILAAVWAYSAWATYKLDARGWWLIVISLCLFAISHVLTYSQHDLIELYRLMGYTEQQIEQMRKFNFFTSGSMVWFPLVFMLPFLGYLIYVKRFFHRAHCP